MNLSDDVLHGRGEKKPHGVKAGSMRDVPGQYTFLFLEKVSLLEDTVCEVPHINFLSKMYSLCHTFSSSAIILTVQYHSFYRRFLLILLLSDAQVAVKLNFIPFFGNYLHHTKARTPYHVLF